MNLHLPRLSLFLVAPLALCLMGADAPRPYTTSRIIRIEEDGFYMRVKLQLTEIGGCQYVVALPADNRAGVSIVHHAACTNPAHVAKPVAP